MVSGKGLVERVVKGKDYPGRLLPHWEESTHLRGSGPQRVHMAASDVNRGTCLAELQGDAAANTSGSTCHYTHLALHGSCHDSQAKGANLWKQRLALREACILCMWKGAPDSDREGSQGYLAFLAAQGIKKGAQWDCPGLPTYKDSLKGADRVGGLPARQPLTAGPSSILGYLELWPYRAEPGGTASRSCVRARPGDAES